MAKLIEKYLDYEKTKKILKKHEEYLHNLEKKKEAFYKKNKIDVVKEKEKSLKTISGLEETNKINLNEYISDKNFIKNVDKIKWYQLIKRIKRRFKPHVLVVIHRPDNNDSARFFPLAKNHLVKIKDEYYLFNPAHFRYINGQAVLYFYQDNPFAKLINVNDGYQEPTISAEAFSSILTSKFVKDAVTGEGTSLKIVWFIVLIILSIILMILNFLTIAGVDKISKLLAG